MCKRKGTKTLITAKTVLQCRILKASKDNVNDEETEAKVQTTAKYMQCDAQARAGTKGCSAKTG